MIEKRSARHSAKALTATSRMRDAVARSAGRAKLVGGAIGDTASAVPEMIAAIKGPELPLRETWSVGIGQVLSGHPQLPAKLRGLALSLDRLGHLQISPDAIGFDGEEVPWKKIKGITFGPAMDVVTSRSLQHEVGRLTRRLPPVPGRDWLVRRAVEFLVALCYAAAGKDDADANAPGADAAIGVPMSITYGGALRSRDLAPGVFAALVAASVPAVSEAIASTARERGITMTIAPQSRSREQAIAMRKLADSLADRLGRGERGWIEDGDAEELSPAHTGEIGALSATDMPATDLAERDQEPPEWTIR